jgi:ceramide glucosyltransferase
LVAALRRARKKPASGPTDLPGISILKPVYGRDPEFYDAIRSHAAQEYPEFEILFGARDREDAALEDVARLRDEFPRVPISAVISSTYAPNPKVGVLADLARRARHGVLLVNDSDIRVPPDYLRRVVAPLSDPAVGLVTCLYRAAGESFPARFEALGIATEFAPSVLVARAVGVAEFALGSTMALRAADLRAAGGFEAIGEYLADDYQLGRRISELGLRVAFAGIVVETRLSGRTWRDVWRHQVRWARTIRVSRRGGYLGYAATQATLWSLLAFAAGEGRIAMAVLALRITAGVLCGAAVLGDRNTVRMAWLIPARDLWGFAVWLAGLLGATVDWRGLRIRLGPEGKIV